MPKKRQPVNLRSSSIDFGLLIAVLILVGFGVLMVYDASVVEAFLSFSDKFHFVRLQFRWAVLSILVLGVFSFIPYRIWHKISLPLFIISLILLVVVLIPGIGTKVGGARRWLTLGGLTLQPAEIVKLTFIIYLSSWLSKRQSFWPFVFLSAILLGLVILEPDLGTAVVTVGTGFLVYFLSGAPLLALSGISLGGIIVGALLILSSTYRRSRLLTFLNPASDPLGASYHIRQILIALGSGGLFGQGLGQSRQKYAYLPEATTDSIFAIIGEEMGFLGGALITFCFLVVIYRGFQIARRAPDRFSQLLAAGLISSLALQICINLASMVALVPLTGVPLPFISYGGSSLVTNLAGIGIILNISRFSHRSSKL